MKAAYYETFKGPVTITQLPDPIPAAKEVIIQVKATGLCRSDWHGWQGHDSDIQLPHVPGHELAGIIVATGRDIRSWKKDDRVTVPFCIGCGTCEDRCPVGAAKVVDTVSKVDETICIGCGACTSTCTTESIRLSRRQEVKTPPNIQEFATARFK